MSSSSIPFNFAEWPPSLSPEQQTTLIQKATTRALATGLLYLPPGYPLESPPPQAAIHAPLSLFPAPFSRESFEFAQEIQSLYNVLYSHIAMDTEFLDEIMGAEKGVGRVDDFIGELWKGWKVLRDSNSVPQPLHLGLFRSDYLYHLPPEGEAFLKQVEFNTISVSFGCLSQRIAELHRQAPTLPLHLMLSTSYFNSSPHLKLENLPKNDTIAGLAKGIAAGHAAYVSNGGSPSSKILFVVQAGERNVFDQRWLEYELLEKHSIHSIRQTFEELITSSSVDTSSSSLKITPTDSPNESIEISVVYYRAGYMPHEYPSQEYYSTRFKLESSRAIKCPTIPLQLAGGKKIQEVLGRKGLVERFLPGVPQSQVDRLRKTFMDMWGLDEDSRGAVGDVTSTSTTDSASPSPSAPPPTSSESFGTQRARAEHATLVLKPQREGGGNNVYKSDIPAFLDGLPAHEREAWIAMRLIEVPQGLGGWLIRAGSLDYGGSSDKSRAERAVKAEVVSELGIFGWALFGAGKVQGEEEVGWLVRTKGKDSNEGGVATGFSVLDSVLLV
ncbi:glutathione synthase [Ephemerocybe angulata]|uniref:Glutathione synthetase n=1 Tax=Ephemerocybe angulata TaxID=980116 RepID=A0A8H6I1T7_9AGAR|nr:glutathione synthase [Tulosesus angulatus]